MSIGTEQVEPVALEDLFAAALSSLAAGDEDEATATIDLITAACGTDTETERPRFEAAVTDEDAREELLDDLQTMGALMQVMPPVPAPRVFNFALPEQTFAEDRLAHIQPNPSALRGLVD